MNPYETDALLQQYLIFHYADSEAQFSYDFGATDGLEFPRRCVTEGVDFDRLPSTARALDVGCSVGGASFELARHFDAVIGVDFSATFIQAAQRLQRDGEHPIFGLESRAGSTTTRVRVDSRIARQRVVFQTGDAQNLPETFGGFDAVIACNLICRLPDPFRFLQRLPNLVVPGGQLFITTPFSWLEAYTPKQNWLGKRAEDSFDGLRRALEPEFELEALWDMPFLIREHARKFQYSIAQASRWCRV